MAYRDKPYVAPNMDPVVLVVREPNETKDRELTVEMFDDLRYAQLVRRELERRVMSRGKTLDILLVQEDGRIVPSNTPLDRNPLVSELGAMLGCLATAEARLKGISGCTRDPRTDKE